MSRTSSGEGANDVVAGVPLDQNNRIPKSEDLENPLKKDAEGGSTIATASKKKRKAGEVDAIDQPGSSLADAANKRRKQGTTNKSVVDLIEKDIVENLPAVTPVRSRYGSMVRITIGRGSLAKCYDLHHGLLVQNSKYFRRAFANGMAETHARHLTLPEDDPEVFETFYVWLYEGELTCAGNVDHDQEGKDVQCYPDLATKMYLFADKYDIPYLANDAIDCILGCSTASWELCTNIAEIYANTTPSSPLRLAVLATYTKIPRVTKGLCRICGPELIECPEFLLDLAMGLSTKCEQLMDPDDGDDDQWDLEEKCSYHLHKNGASCVQT